MEARVALQLLSEEQLLLPLPHEWALLPWTIEEPASSPLPRWVARVFSWPTLASTIELFSNTRSSCCRWGCWTWWFSSLSSTFHQELDSQFPQDRLAGTLSLS